MTDAVLDAPPHDGGPDADGRVAVSTASQLGAKVVHLGLNVVSTLVIIRYLSPDAYGAYVVVLTTTLLVGLFADFGLAKLAVREVTRARVDEHEVLGTVVAIRLGLALVATVLVQLALLALGRGAEVHAAGAVASLVFFGDAVLAAVVVVFHVRIRQHYEALVRVGMEVVETALIIALVASGASLPWLFVPPTLGPALGAVAVVLLARRRFGTRLRFAPARVRHLLREALPIGPALLIGVVYLKLDSYLLAALRPEREVGLYGSAYQPVEYLFLATAVIINVLFPMLSAAHAAGDGERFGDLYRRGTELLVAGTLFVPLVFAFVAPALVTSVFGEDYADAAGPLRLLGFALVLMTVNAWQSLVLLAGGLQRVTLRYNAVALVVAVVLCVGLIRLIGLNGAAFATLGTAVYVLAASTRAVRRGLGANLELAPLGRIVLAAAASAVLLAGLHALGTPWLLLGVLATVTYAGALHLTGSLRPLLAVLR